MSRRTMERYTERHQAEAMDELREELARFCHDGLVQLREDLRAGLSVRGSWYGCPISYKSGAPGSGRRDRMGRARNAFTVLWDNGWIADEDVLLEIGRELNRRQAVPERALEPAREAVAL